MKSTDNPLHPATFCVHSGTHLDEKTGGICSPIFSSTSYGYPNAADVNVYPRYFNVPNQVAVAKKVAALEKAEAALVFSSGMAAISTTLLTLLKSGDHALFQGSLYGGTYHFATAELPRLGIEVSFANTPEEFSTAVRKNTRLIYVESPSNPLLRCIDLAAIGELGKTAGLPTVIDNTFATPVNQNPTDLGIEVVVHSGTKYLNGHSDVNCGVVVSSHAMIARVARSAVEYGGTLDSHACYQLERGLKTLYLRVRQQNQSAGKIAAFLASHTSVSRVHYPGLPQHPDHAVALRQMRGFGGMLSFELKEPTRVDSFLAKLQVITPALSLGGVESLVCAPSRTSHRSLSPAERRTAGIAEGLLRLSVGIEELEDLVDDLDQALS
jgi:cystathionine beta-lyase/cystathionine gamma-synthase